MIRTKRARHTPGLDKRLMNSVPPLIVSCDCRGYTLLAEKLGRHHYGGCVPTTEKTAYRVYRGLNLLP